MDLDQNTTSNTFYAQDVDYASGFIVDQMPIRLSYVAALMGYMPPVPQKPFAYCELGCSIGITLNTLAAANPESHFYGVDFNAKSIEKARQAAYDAGLDNVSYQAKSFDDLDLRDFPSFDYITMQGTYSWLPPETVSAVIDFLARKLKPGGLFYLEYLLLPALAAAEPVARLMRELTANMPTSSIKRAESALEKMISLCRNNVDFFVRNPQAVNTVAGWDKEREISPHWAVNIAHAQLSGNWDPKYVTEVADELCMAGLSRVGSTTLPLNDINFAVPKEHLPMLDDIDDPLLVELLSDYMTNRSARHDVFIKDAQPAPEQARDFLHHGVYLTPRAPLSELKPTIKVPGREEISLHGPEYQALLKSLDSMGTSISELLSRTNVPGISDDRLFIATTHLIASGKLFMCMKNCNPSGTLNEVTTFSIPLSYNRYLLDQLKTELCEKTLASPVTGGGGVSLPVLEALLLQLWVDEGYPGLINRALAILQQSSAAFQIDKHKFHASEITESMLNNSLNVLKQRRAPNLVRMGVLKTMQP